MPETTTEPAIETRATAPEAIETGAVANGSAKSDEDLVGLEPEAYRAEYRNPEEPEAEGEGLAASRDESEVPAREEEIAAGQPLPDSFKKAIAANPEIKAELQRLWDQHQAFREIFPTVAEARAVKELFPGGAEQARTAVSKAREMEHSDALFVSREPHAQRELAANMLEFDPRAFGAMLQVGAELVRERNPQLYQAFVSSLTGQAPAGGNFPEQLTKIAQALENNDSQSLRQFATELVRRAQEGGALAGSRAPLGTTARSATATAREEYLERQLNSMTEEQGASFSVSVNRTVLPHIDAEVRKLIAPAAKGLPAYAREGAMQSLAGQIHAGIEQRLKSDHHYHDQLASIQASLSYGAKNHDSVTKAIVTRALLHLKPVAKQVLQAWTPRQIEQGRQSAEKAESAARRTDISGGGLTYGRPSAKLTRDEAHDMSDEQLIDWALRR